MVNIRREICPSDKWDIKCPNKMTPTRIVIHNTANDAPAKNEIAYCEAYYFENNPNIAFLYKTYKFYCANNYKNRAKLYWEEIHKLDRV